MSFAGHAANSSGCVVRPKGRATGLIGFAEKIQRYSLIGSSAMEAAEHREPCESRGSCTDLGAPGGEIPPGDSTTSDIVGGPRHGSFMAEFLSATVQTRAGSTTRSKTVRNRS